MSGFYGTPVIAPAAINTIQIENGDGSTLFAVVTGEETILTATDNDVREGLVYASDGGISTGSKVIPSYHTTESARFIDVGKELNIPLPAADRYDYTKLQVIVCSYDTSLSNSVATEKVVINDNIYNVGETISISTVFKNEETKTIELGLINDGDKPLILRCFTYKEID